MTPANDGGVRLALFTCVCDNSDIGRRPVVSPNLSGVKRAVSKPKSVHKTSCLLFQLIFISSGEKNEMLVVGGLDIMLTTCSVLKNKIQKKSKQNKQTKKQNKNINYRSYGNS